ncbi:MAG: hypothetical protein ABEI53_02855 [Candidatus Magasanikbacteria bacterium]
MFQAQAISKSQLERKGIEFPIKELGSCSSIEDCRKFCNKPKNMKACMKFARENGLVKQKKTSQESLKEVEKFSTALEDGGPGGCSTVSECKNYCSKISHLEECVKFAKKHNLDQEEMRGAKKLLNYIRKGGETPGNCKTKSECRRYCSKPSHAKECIKFAKKVGFKGVDKEEMKRMRKFSRLVKKGKTPGNCSTQAECQRYCSKPSHSRECFQFAKKNNLIPEEEKREMKREMQEMREQFGNMPSQIKECLRKSIGKSRLKEIRKGKALPGPSFGRSMQKCANNFSPKRLEAEEMKKGLQSELDNFPPKVKSCIKNSLKSNTFEKLKSGSMPPGPKPKIEEVIEKCMNKLKGPPKRGRDAEMSPREIKRQMKEELSRMPDKVKSCLKNTIGKEKFSELQSGSEAPGPQFGEAIDKCMNKFHEEKRPESEKNLNESNLEAMKERAQEELSNLPRKAEDCLVKSLGKKKFKSLRSGSVTPGPEVGEAMEKCMRKVDERENSMKKEPDSEHSKRRLAPAESFPDYAKKCFKKKYGKSIEDVRKNDQLNSKVMDVVESCLKKDKLEREINRKPSNNDGYGIPEPPEGEPSPPHFDKSESRKNEPQKREEHKSDPDFQIPEPVRKCFQQKSGVSFKEFKNNSTQKLENIIENCMNSFRQSSSNYRNPEDDKSSYKNSLKSGFVKMLSVVTGPAL